jgi:hypothetical protein
MNRGGRQAPGAGYGQQQAQQGGNAGLSQNQYGQASSQGQDPSQGQGDQYGQDQYGAGNYDQQQQEDGDGQQGDEQANGDISGNQKDGQDMNGVDGQEHGDEDQENDAQNGDENMMTKKKTASTPTKKTPSKMGTKNQFTPKPQYAHSRFGQDPHHHKTMMNFHNIACKYSLSHLLSQSRIQTRADVNFSGGSQSCTYRELCPHRDICTCPSCKAGGYDGWS